MEDTIVVCKCTTITRLWEWGAITVQRTWCENRYLCFSKTVSLSYCL